MVKKYLPIPIVLLGLINFALIAYIRLFSPHYPQHTRSINDSTNLVFSLTPTPTDNTPSSIKLVLTGDIMLGREVDYQSRLHGNLYPFEKIRTVTADADLTFGNLESPFFEGCPETHGGYTFCARPRMVEGLLASGFDVLSIENNHLLNYGQSGKDQTIDILTNNDIIPSQNNLAIKRHNDITIGFLSFDLTVNNDPAPILQVVGDAAPQVDILIVSLHWGVEYEKQPRDWQVELAHEIIDAGAKIIAGGHPHVTQPVEEYHDGLIYYSLGNFIFDQMWSEETKSGMIATIILEDDQIVSHHQIPTYTKLIGQPEAIN